MTEIGWILLVVYLAVMILAYIILGMFFYEYRDNQEAIACILVWPVTIIMFCFIAIIVFIISILTTIVKAPIWIGKKLGGH